MFASLRATTLFAPACWFAAAALFALATIAAGYADDPFVRYAAAVLAITPTLAQLGAKRPQNGAWQFIVLTLVGVLLLPVVQGLAFGDDRPHVHMLFRWLIAAHIVIGAVNYLPTRFAGPALMYGAGQTILAADHLPWPIPQYVGPAAGITSFVAALLWAIFLARRPSTISPGLDRLWHDFRDAYGLVWGLRIAERMNAAAQRHKWPIEFTWNGIVRADANLKSEISDSQEVQHRIERELRSLLRRFVSHEWIARRITGGRRSC